MTHSAKFSIVKKYYDRGMWTEMQVYEAVGRWITPEEFTEITGNEYITE